MCQEKWKLLIHLLFPNFPKLPNFPKKLLCDFCVQIFPTTIMKTILVWSPKKVCICFAADVDAIFWSQTTLGAIFARIFRDIALIFRDFAWIFRNFVQIFRDFARTFDKSKLLGVRLHPLHPRLLHHYFGLWLFFLSCAEMPRRRVLFNERNQNIYLHCNSVSCC